MWWDATLTCMHFQSILPMVIIDTAQEVGVTSFVIGIPEITHQNMWTRLEKSFTNTIAIIAAEKHPIEELKRLYSQSIAQDQIWRTVAFAANEVIQACRPAKMLNGVTQLSEPRGRLEPLTCHQNVQQG